MIETNVKVSIVFPGAMETNIMSNSGIQNRQTSNQSSSMKALPASKAAAIIIKGMEQDRLRIFVGNDSKMMDFLVRLNPVFAGKLIYKQMKTLLQ